MIIYIYIYDYIYIHIYIYTYTCIYSSNTLRNAFTNNVFRTPLQTPCTNQTHLTSSQSAARLQHNGAPPAVAAPRRKGVRKDVCIFV